MRWNDSATGPAAALQMFTMPVASCSVVVAARIGSIHSSSAGGEPPAQIAPYPSPSMSRSCCGDSCRNRE